MCVRPSGLPIRSSVRPSAKFVVNAEHVPLCASCAAPKSSTFLVSRGSRAYIHFLLDPIIHAVTTRKSPACRRSPSLFLCGCRRTNKRRLKYTHIAGLDRHSRVVSTLHQTTAKSTTTTTGCDVMMRSPTAMSAMIATHTCITL